MGLHEHAHHGRVFRGLEAKKHLEMQKRNSYTTGDKIKLNVPEGYVENHAVENDDVATYTAVIYTTVSADFDGPTAGYTTFTAAQTIVSTSDSSVATPTAGSSSSLSPEESSYLAAKSSAAATTSALAASHITATASASTATTSNDGSNNKSLFLNPPASTSSSSSATATALKGTPMSQASTESTGMSGGAKAGLAFGIILALACALGLLLFCWRRRKNQNDHETLNEKRASSSSSFFGGKAMSEKHISTASEQSGRTAAATAPRLSLRPVTQFLPNLGNTNDNRKSAGNALDVPAMAEKPRSMWERRSQNEENPFGDANQLSEKQAERPVSPPTNPFDEPEGESPPKNATLAPAAAAPVAAASSPAPRGPNNVHRVQLDFKPSMDDELELKSGQLVRMLHEYDDGWALCIRMDRSQQGVVPRTCLSKLPVKPRPQGPPPPQANGRPMTPQGPAGVVPRPLTPNGGRERSGSNAGMPIRKPVPGQAS